jgi:hypothetical protein
VNKSLFGFIFILIFSHLGEARIRMNKVKEAPKVCKIMAEDSMLSRDGKKVFGTLRHSLVFERSENLESVSLIKDKGEKICQWPGSQWEEILKNNGFENLTNFKYHIDEYKEILYPYATKPDGSYFVMNIPFADCGLSEQSTREKLDIPKCVIPKKKSKKRRARRVAKK